jgi:hypothetical protein
MQVCQYDTKGIHIDLECFEADWLNEFYPSRVKGNAKKLSDTKRESDKMPVTPKESARARKIHRNFECNKCCSYCTSIQFERFTHRSGKLTLQDAPGSMISGLAILRYSPYCEKRGCRPAYPVHPPHLYKPKMKDHSIRKSFNFSALSREVTLITFAPPFRLLLPARTNITVL